MSAPSRIYSATAPHWVGDGFLVQSLFSVAANNAPDPFLLLDYAAPHEFAPGSASPRGVGVHPHKGFETVTIAYAGEVAHRDSSGGGGVIGAGDVQWMTAGAGIVHEEFHSPAFSQRGGCFEMVQLWVNLPARFKNVPPRYQHLQKEDIPTLELEQGARLRLIAGAYQGQRGAAETHTPVNLWDVHLPAGREALLTVPNGQAVALLLRRGHLSWDDGSRVRAGEWCFFEAGTEQISLHAGDEDVEALWLSGESLREPIAAYGPFVMNHREEIIQAIDDFQSGRFGALA